MKKYITIFTLLIFLFSLIACNSEKVEEVDSQDNQAASQSSVENTSMETSTAQEENAEKIVTDSLANAKIAALIIGQSIDITEETSGSFQAVDMETQSVPGVLEALENFTNLQQMPVYYQTVFTGTELERRVNGYYEETSETKAYDFIEGKLYVNNDLSIMQMGVLEWDAVPTEILEASTEKIVAKVGATTRENEKVEKELTLLWMDDHWVFDDSYCQF